jgi:hypothetical protein
MRTIKATVPDITFATLPLLPLLPSGLSLNIEFKIVTIAVTRQYYSIDETRRKWLNSLEILQQIFDYQP